jgi:hypothetical protein
MCSMKTLNHEVVWCSVGNMRRVLVHDTEVVFNRDWCATKNMHTG